MEEIMKSLRRTLAILLALVMLLSACSPANSNAPATEADSSAGTDAAPKSGSDNPVEITFMIPEWGAPSQEMLDEFQAKENIKVNLETVDWDDIRNKVSVAAAGQKAAADVFEVDWAWVGEFTSAGWITPIEIPDEDKTSFVGLDTFTIDGNVMALSYANDYRISYMNTDAYEKAGLAEPQTWDDVYNSSKVIKEKGIMEYPFTFPYAAEESATTGLLWLTFLRTGKVFNDDNTLNKQNVTDTLTYVDKMLKEGLVDPANATMKGGQTYAQMTEGVTAFMTGPSSYVGRIEDPEQSKVIGKSKAIIPVGGTSKATQTMALQEAIGVSPYSENVEAAKTFARWFTSPEIQIKMFEVKGCIPTRSEILNQLIKSGDIKGGDVMIKAAELIKSVFPTGVPNYYTEMSTAIFNAVNKMALGQSTPEQAFEEMNAKVTELATK